jgi:hypothetical protein
MKNKMIRLSLLFLCLIFFSVSDAQVKEEPKVNEILNWQLKALKNNSYENFIKRGNKAFKELTTKFDFETIYLDTKNKLKEYNLSYLGSVKRTGMTEYLWKFVSKDDNKEHLIRLSLSKNGEYIVGFDFD